MLHFLDPELSCWFHCCSISCTCGLLALSHPALLAPKVSPAPMGLTPRTLQGINPLLFRFQQEKGNAEPDQRLLPPSLVSHYFAREFETPLHLCYKVARCIWSVLSEKIKAEKIKLGSWKMKPVSTDRAGQFTDLSSLDQGMKPNPLDGIWQQDMYSTRKCSLGNNPALQRRAANSWINVIVITEHFIWHTENLQVLQTSRSAPRQEGIKREIQSCEVLWLNSQIYWWLYSSLTQIKYPSSWWIFLQFWRC